MASRVVVIGGGLGGLAAGVRRGGAGASRDRARQESPGSGGKAAVLHLPDPERPGSNQGFRFDMGPTILTVPRVLRRIYRRAGRTSRRNCRSSARPAVALLLRRQHAHRPEETWPMARAMDASPGRGQAGLPPLPGVAKPCTTFGSFFFWKPVEASRHLD
jgi:phytoene dehydrogenase-like protein